MKIVLATRNLKKIEEIRRIVAGLTVDLLSLAHFPDCPEVVEDGRTFRENAEKKAVQVAKFTQCHALADDSGLVVDALGGAPGVYSARFAGPQATDEDNVRLLLATLSATGDVRRVAHFECVLSLSDPAGSIQNFSGTVTGRIGQHPQGDNGFGYDPIFVPDGSAQTFAQMLPHDKDSMSHRGRALAAFAKALARQL